MWWSLPAISAFRRLRLEDLKLQASVGTQNHDLVSKKKRGGGQKKKSVEYFFSFDGKNTDGIWDKATPSFVPLDTKWNK